MLKLTLCLLGSNFKDGWWSLQTILIQVRPYKSLDLIWDENCLVLRFHIHVMANIWMKRKFKGKHANNCLACRVKYPCLHYQLKLLLALPRINLFTPTWTIVEPKLGECVKYLAEIDKVLHKCTSGLALKGVYFVLYCQKMMLE